jgi:acetolactate decarboxylase
VKSITCNLPGSLYDALQKWVGTDNSSCDHVVSQALSQWLWKSKAGVAIATSGPA